MPENQDGGSGVQVIARAASVLRALKGSTAGLSLGQLATEVALPRSTVQRIVSALQQERLVISAGPNGGIRLGPEIAALAEAGRIDTVDLVHPYLARLSERTGETVDLAVLRGNRLIFVDQVAGSHRLRAVTFIGETFPLHNTANGKAVLALLDDPSALLLASAGAAGDAIDAPRLLDELRSIRETGFASDLEEHTPGICAVGGALIDINGDVYSVSIPTPTTRFTTTHDELVASLHDTLAEIHGLAVFTN